MDMSFEDQVRERAYHIWEAGGMADGQAHDHWMSAEQAVKAAHADPVVILTKPVAKSAKVVKATKAVAKPAAKATPKAAAKPAVTKKSKGDAGKGAASAL